MEIQWDLTGFGGWYSVIFIGRDEILSDWTEFSGSFYDIVWDVCHPICRDWIWCLHMFAEFAGCRGFTWIYCDFLWKEHMCDVFARGVFLQMVGYHVLRWPLGCDPRGWTFLWTEWCGNVHAMEHGHLWLIFLQDGASQICLLVYKPL